MVFLVGVLPLFVEVDQFLVHQPIEQLEILETFLSLAGFPEPILSSADVVQHILDVVVAKRLPRVLLEDSDLYVGRILAHPAHLLLMLLPLPFFLADRRELDVLPVRDAEHAFAHFHCALHYLLPKN